MEERIAVMSGTGVLSKAQIMAFLAHAIPAGHVIDTRSSEPPPVKAPKTEIEIWNDQVERRKAERNARRGR